MNMYPTYPGPVELKIILELKTKMNKPGNTFNQAISAALETALTGEEASQ